MTAHDQVVAAATVLVGIATIAALYWACWAACRLLGVDIPAENEPDEDIDPAGAPAKPRPPKPERETAGAGR